MKKSEFIFIYISYFLWIILLFGVIFFSKLIALQQTFLGGGVVEYITNPYLWSWANFDGQHYLEIAKSGYAPLTYFFFPAYPLLIKIVSNFLGTFSLAYLLSGLFISHISLLISLVVFFRTVESEFGSKVAKLSSAFLLLFPTSYFFGAIYTESLFLAMCLLSFYFARKGNFILGGIFAAIASATRVVGIALFPALIIELLLQKKWPRIKNILGVLLSPIGFFGYAIYLKVHTGSFFEFFNNISIFGEQRQSAIILLPQVFYRYFFKILPNLNWSYFPVVFTTILELFTATFVLIILILSFKKLRLSYWIFSVVAYLIPTFSGSFSSLPRYVLILFPIFIFLGNKFSKHKLTFVFLFVSFILLLISFGLFVRGYWIS